MERLGPLGVYRFGRHQPQPGVPVLLLVPVEEGPAERSALLDPGEAAQETETGAK